MKRKQNEHHRRAKRNAGFLAVSNLAGLGLPLIELPFLARALGVDQYGALLFIQALALTASTFVEYGFHYSGARSIAQADGEREIQRRAVVDITVAKMMIYAATMVVVLPLYFLNFEGGVPFGALFLAVITASFGFSPTWYYLGAGRLRFPVMFDVAIRAAGLLLIVLFVRTPEHLVLALSIQCAAGLINTVVPTIVMIRRTGVGRPSAIRSFAYIREGWHFFLYKSASSISSSIATTILGISSTIAQVGLFAPSEKLIRAGSTLVTATISAFFPAAVKDIATEGDAYKGRLIKPIALLFVFLLCGACLFAVSAEFIVHLAFGEAFTQGAPLLQLMAFLMPFRATSGTLSILWLIPSGNEALSSRLALANVLFVLVFGLIVAPLAGAAGLAVVLATAEVCLFVAMILIVWRAPMKAKTMGMRE